MNTNLRDVQRRVFKWSADKLIRGLALDKANRLTCNLVEQIAPIYDLESDGTKLRFYCPNALTRWRAESLFTKEPETIEWINSFDKGDVLFDIGANVGMYSIYAGKRGVKVLAFEPESQNYALINRNIHLNDLSETVRCLSVAISDAETLDYLYLPHFQPGGAMNNFGDNLDLNHERFDSAFKQGGISFPLDGFLKRYPDLFPNHLKIDVDGIEDKIVRGARETLKSPCLRSVSIELNESLPETPALVAEIESFGLKLKHRKHGEMVDHGSEANIYNFLFVRS